MTKEEISNIIGSKSNNKKLSLADLSRLKEIANVDFELDRDNNEYYYKINLDDLTNKVFDLELLMNYGWKIINNDLVLIY